MQHKFIHKVRKVARYSYSITIPKQVIKKTRWKERQKLVLTFDDKKKTIIIKDWKPKK